MRRNLRSWRMFAARRPLRVCFTVKKQYIGFLALVALLASFTNAECNFSELNTSCCEHDLNKTITGQVVTSYTYSDVTPPDTKNLLFNTVFPIVMWIMILVLLYFMLLFVINLFGWLLNAYNNRGKPPE